MPAGYLAYKEELDQVLEGKRLRGDALVEAKKSR